MSKTSPGVHSQCTDGNNMAEVLFYVDDQTSITHVTYPAIIDLFAQLGALWTSGILVLRFFFVWMNRRKAKELKYTVAESSMKPTETDEPQVVKENEGEAKIIKQVRRAETIC